jgi:predicted ArsR family transcriptional regulator
MFVAGFRDLVKPQWVTALRELKLAGGLPVSELSRRMDASYMAVKQYCEDLKKLGYLERSRVPRTAVGRPEIFYRLSPKADALLPQPPIAFPLELLEQARTIFGETAPERLIFQHFQQQLEQWGPSVAKASSLEEKARTLAALREKQGCYNRVVADATGLRIEEFHHPLHHLFERYPRAVSMELRAIEQLLGTRITRSEVPGGRAGPARVDFILPGEF